MKNFTPAPIESLLLQLQAVAPSWAKRHWPIVPANGHVEQGVSCSFIRKIALRSSGDQRGVYFEVGSYVNGHAPDQIQLDFNASEPNITTERVRDSQGNEREIVTICRCVALGETIIVENVKGSGGVGAVQALLGRLFRSYLVTGTPPRSYPTIELLDVTSRDLRTAIRRGRGVERVFLRMIDGAEQAEDGWARPLKAGKDRIRNSAKFSAVWEAADNGVLNTDDVVSAVDESLEDDSALEKVVLILKDGNKLTGLGSYKARTTVSVTMDNAGVLFYSELIEGLWGYLDELRRTRDTWRLIDDNGFFNADAPIDLQQSS
jgi:hypothetical protein